MRSKVYFNIFKFCFKVVFAVFLIFSPDDSKAQNQIEGVWKSADNKYMVKVSSLGDEYHGRIVWLNDPSMLDVKNPDEKLSKLPVKGSKILEGLKYNPSEGNWVGGTLYIPETGQYYQCTVSVDGNKLKMIYKPEDGQPTNTWSWVRQ